MTANEKGIEIVYNQSSEKIPLAGESKVAANTCSAGSSGFNPAIWERHKPTKLTSITEEKTTKPESLEVIEKWSHLCICHFRSFFFNIIFLFGLFVVFYGLFGKSRLVVYAGCVFLGLGFLLSCMELCCCSSSTRYFFNLMSREEVRKHMVEMKSVAPKITWHINCFHLEEQNNILVPVSTHESTGMFVYSAFRDISMKLPDLSKQPLNKLDLHLQVIFGDRFTMEEYHRQKEFFVQVNTSDERQTITAYIELNGLRHRVLCEGDPGTRPCCLSSFWFVISGLVGLSFFYRLWMDCLMGRSAFMFEKSVFCVPDIEPSQMKSIKPPMPEKLQVGYRSDPKWIGKY